MKHILFITNDKEIQAQALSYFSSFEEYKVTLCSHGQEAINCIKASAYHAIILDTQLPDIHGNEVCIQARNFTNTPILMISSYNDVHSRIQGLRDGADDYIGKPISFEEVKLRMELRMFPRNEERPARKLIVHDLCIDTGTLRASYKDCECQLSVIEFSILELLARQPQRIFSYEQIYASVWKEPINASRHTLQARVAELRLKLETLCEDVSYIHTVRGKGYQFYPKEKARD